jgi:two-component system sensor histidine kinase DegS
MPEMDGFEVLQQLKPLIPEGEYLPVLVLTADMGRETKHRAFSMGASDFLVKPFDAMEVLLRINNLLQTRFLHLELRRNNQLLENKVLERTGELTRMLYQVMSAQEIERRRLSMDVHDGPLQSLGIQTMNAERAIRRHQRGEHDLVLKELYELRGGLASTIAEMRSVLADLSLDLLTSYGLATALRKYAERFTDLTDIEVKVTIGDSASGKLTPQVQLLIYRLAQEAFSNIRKHAQATEADLSLSVKDHNLYLTISDNGVGFDVSAALREHQAGEQIGLRSMQERIRNAQGELQIYSVLGKGTSLVFRCPLTATIYSTETLAGKLRSH